MIHSGLKDKGTERILITEWVEWDTFTDTLALAVKDRQQQNRLQKHEAPKAPLLTPMALWTRTAAEERGAPGGAE